MQQPRELPRLGSVSHAKRISNSNRADSIPISTNTNTIGFKSVLDMTDRVLREHYPYYARSLKRKRDWGLQSAIEIFSNLSNKAEALGRKTYDVEENRRNFDFLRRQIQYNRDKYARDNILNSERSEILPEQVVNALKSFNFYNIPISKDGVLLNNMTEQGHLIIGNTMYHDFNRKGNLNPLKIPRLRYLVSENTNVPIDKVSQFPEYRILHAWISKRNRFQNELQKILKYQNKMNNPQRMAKLISNKIGSLPPNVAVNQNIYDTARSFIHPSDMENLRELGENILLPAELHQFSSNKERLRPFFNKMLNSSKLNPAVKTRFAQYMEKYPNNILDMNI